LPIFTKPKRNKKWDERGKRGIREENGLGKWGRPFPIPSPFYLPHFQGIGDIALGPLKSRYHLAWLGRKPKKGKEFHHAGKTLLKC